MLSACICGRLLLTSVSSSAADMEQNHRELHPTRGNTAELRDSVEQTRPQCVSTEHPTRGNTAELRDSVEQTRPQCVSTEHRDATTVLNGTPRLRDVSEAVCT